MPPAVVVVAVVVVAAAVAMSLPMIAEYAHRDFYPLAKFQCFAASAALNTCARDDDGSIYERRRLRVAVAVVDVVVVVVTTADATVTVVAVVAAAAVAASVAFAKVVYNAAGKKRLLLFLWTSVDRTMRHLDHPCMLDLLNREGATNQMCCSLLLLLLLLLLLHLRL